MSPIRIMAALTVLSLISACGVDGPPQPPQPRENPAPTGASVTLRGEAGIGVVGGT